MKTWPDRDEAIEDSQGVAKRNIGKLHPTDQVEAWDKLKEFATNEEKLQQKYNDEHGIPERR